MFSDAVYDHRSGYYPSQPPGIAPPPYDSQGESYHRMLPADDEEGGSSPLEGVTASSSSPLPDPPLLNSFRYPKSLKRFRGSGAGPGGHAPYPKEVKKTLVGGAFVLLNFLATTVALSITHERVPRYEPLPDIILDFFRYQHWALTASEVLLSVQTVTAVLIIVFHKHRYDMIST